MKRCIILSGVSGSGKSIQAQLLSRELAGDGCLTVSADQYFYEEDKYCFDASKLGEAHAWCFRKFINNMQRDTDDMVSSIIVDNTNTTVEEISPYILGATAFGYAPEVLTIATNDNEETIKLLAARNQHGVPINSIRAQMKRLQARKLPTYWKQQTMKASF